MASGFTEAPTTPPHPIPDAPMLRAPVRVELSAGEPAALPEAAGVTILSLRTIEVSLTDRARRCYTSGMTARDGDFVRAFRERATREREVILEARRRAREAADRAVRTVAARFRPRRLLLIGSLPRGTFRPGSDIDLAVEGLTAEECEAAERAAREAAGVDVDVRRLESMDPEWRAHHVRFGQVAYERERP